MASRFHDRRSNDARSFINIDDLLKAFSSAEKAEGLPETFKQIIPDTVTSLNVGDVTLMDVMKSLKKRSLLRLLVEILICHSMATLVTMTMGFMYVKCVIS